ncbi:MAG: shikimate kinase [Methylicorpusculum sp.]|nr:shikimate kinase [Methylicorpusculum sp.]
MGLDFLMTGCVGKTTVGRVLSELLDVPFFDLDEEIEGFFGTSIEQLQSRFKTIHSYRDEAAKALVHLLKRPERRHSVIALPPSGLMGGYLRAVKNSLGVIVALSDKPENILERIVFYDINSKLIEKCLTSSEKRWYLREIKKDITYFCKTYYRAHLRMDISGLDPNQAALCVKQAIEMFESQGKEHGKSEQMDGQKR